MRDKSNANEGQRTAGGEDGAPGPRAAGIGRIRADLERRGIAAEFSEPVARRLSAIADDLSESEYRAVLDGVVAAYGVHRESCAGVIDEMDDVVEIRRLMEGFSGELSKLEEGLQILSAYVIRMSARARPEPSTLH